MDSRKSKWIIFAFSDEILQFLGSNGNTLGNPGIIKVSRGLKQQIPHDKGKMIYFGPAYADLCMDRHERLRITILRTAQLKSAELCGAYTEEYTQSRHSFCITDSGERYMGPVDSQAYQKFKITSDQVTFTPPVGYSVVAFAWVFQSGGSFSYYFEIVDLSGQSVDGIRYGGRANISPWSPGLPAGVLTVFNEPNGDGCRRKKIYY